MSQPATSPIRTFTSGASRDQNATKFDLDGFVSPLVLLRFCEYMHKHRQMADGSLRESDNWQQGIPMDVYNESLRRHVLDQWLISRGSTGTDTDDEEEALCGILFNSMGLLFELLKERGYRDGDQP